MTSIEDSVLIFERLNSCIQEYCQAFGVLCETEEVILKSTNAEVVIKFAKSLDSIINLLKGEIILRTDAFKQEWNRQFIKIEGDEKIKNIEEICTPIWARIDKWHGIQDYRDTALAHNFRKKIDDNGKKKHINIFGLQNQEIKSIPNHISEFLLIACLINLMTLIVTSVYKMELARAFDIVDKNIVNEKCPAIDNDCEYINITNEVFEIINKFPSIKVLI